MTDAELREAFDLLHRHSTAMVHPLLIVLERAWTADRNVIDALRANEIVGHRVYGDNDRHSRRATDLRPVA